MPLSEKARERLADVRELEPTSNGELKDRWGMDSDQDVARYLRDELGEYVYRDDNSKIRAVEGSPDVKPENDGDTSETGAVPQESGGEREGDQEPSERDEGTDEQAQHADETPSGQTLDLQSVETGEGSETGGAGSGTGPTGGQRVELPDDPVTDDGSSDLRPAGGSGGGDGETKPECPECGDVLFRGLEFTAMLNDLKRRREDIRRFLQANQGAAPEFACRDIAGCGYYVEDGEAREFNSPKGKGGWGRRVALGVGTAAVAGVAGLAVSQNAGQNNDDRILGGGGDRVV